MTCLAYAAPASMSWPTISTSIGAGAPKFRMRFTMPPMKK